MIKQILIRLLDFVNPRKPLGTDLFNSLARVSVTSAFETVALRKNALGGGLEVFLVQRSLEEKSYPGAWHLPGTVVRPGEYIENTLGRLARNEYQVSIKNYHLVGYMNNPHEPRGHFLSPIFLVELGESPPVGKWVLVSELGEDVVDFHRNLIIPMAVKQYASQSGHIPLLENVV